MIEGDDGVLVVPDAVAPALATQLDQLLQDASRYATHARAEATLRGYRSDWVDFDSWCLQMGLQALPAAPETVAAYMAALAPRSSPRTSRTSTTTPPAWSSTSPARKPTLTAPSPTRWSSPAPAPPNTAPSSSCRTGADGTEEPADFAGFLASALAAVAANVGSVERVTAGRPGSWESDLVQRLLAGTVEATPEALAFHRTEPVRVPLSVAQLVESASPTGSSLLTFDVAEQTIPWPGTGDGTQQHPWGEGATDAELESREGRVQALSARYSAAYQHYADQFTAAVHETAKAWNLSVPVEVVTDTDPDGFELDNPHEWPYGDADADPLVWRLWSAARDRAGLPLFDGTDAG